MHEIKFVAENPDRVLEMLMDVNEKVLVKCGSDNCPSKRAGRPPYSSAWKTKTIQQWLVYDR